MLWGKEPIKKTFSIDTLSTVKAAQATVSSTNVKRHVCPHCGCDSEQFRETGFLGCSYCYQALRPEIMEYLDEL